MTITLPSGETQTAFVAPNGGLTGTYTVTSMDVQPNGDVTGTSTDAAGNTSTVTTTPFVDNVNPLDPSITTLNVVGGNLMVTGTSEPGSTVTVTFPDNSTAVVSTDSGGNYTVTSAAPQSSGNVTAQSTDINGNMSTVTTRAFATGGGDAGNVSFVVNGSPAAADGSATVTITVVVRDVNNSLVTGETVTLGTAPSGVTFTSQTCTTNMMGVCSITVTSVTSGNFSAGVSIAAGAITGSPAMFTFTDELSIGVVNSMATEGGSAGLFQLRLMAAPSTDITVTTNIAGSAVNGVDYETLTTVVTIPAGSTTLDIVITAMDDMLLEPTETVVLTLLSTNQSFIAVGAVDNAEISIIDNDMSTVTIQDNSALESAGSLDVTVVLSQSIQESFSFSPVLDFSQGSASAADISLQTSTVTFPANSIAGSTQTINLTIVSDTIIEASETLQLGYSNAQGAVMFGPTATITIINDDAPTFGVTTEF